MLCAWGPEFNLDRSMEPIQKTCQRWDEPGHAHAMTFSYFRRQPFLTKDRSRGWMIEAIRRARDEHRFHLWAYVIMPEHLHLLIEDRFHEPTAANPPACLPR